MKTKISCDECWSLKMYCPDCSKINLDLVEEENDFSQNPERQIGRFLTDEEKEQMRLEDKERKRAEEDEN